MSSRIFRPAPYRLLLFAALAIGVLVGRASWLVAQEKDAAGPPAAEAPQPEQVAVAEEPAGAEAEANETSAAVGSGSPVELPQPVTADHFNAIRTQSPFLRTLNLAETYSLRGVAEIGGSPVATLYNRETKKTLTVTRGEVNEAGITMVEVVPATDLNGVSVKVSFAGEVVELKDYNDQLKPKPGSSGGGGSSQSGDGQRRGPSKEDMDRYNSLTDEQKQRFRDYARQTWQKHPNMSREERGNMIRGALARLAETGDIPGAGQDGQTRSQPQSISGRPSGGDRR